MDIQIPFGRDKIQFSIEDKLFAGMYDPSPKKPAEDPFAEVEYAIEHPIGCPPLNEIIGHDRSVNIIIDDNTRPTPIKLILPPLIRKIKGVGVSDKNIKIVAALGSHHYMTNSQLRERVGDEIYDKYKVVNSEFRKKEDLIYLGNTPDGYKVSASKEAMDSEIRIGVGYLCPHSTMGWSGGCKILFPGVTSEDTVAQFHYWGGLSKTNDFGNENCPVRLMVENWVDTIGLHFIVNTILTPEFEIYRVVAGHYVAAHRIGVEYAKKVIGYQVQEKVDVVIVSSHPYDIDLGQAMKATGAAEWALKNESGGTIILVSPVNEGFGIHKDYPRIIAMEDPDTYIKGIMAGKVDIGDADPLAIGIGAAMNHSRKRREIVVVTDGIERDILQGCGYIAFGRNEIQNAIAYVINKYNNPRIAVISNGGETYIYS